MHAALSPSLVLEMLDRIGDVEAASGVAKICKCAVKKLTRRPHERPALQVLLVAGLFADHHQTGQCRTFAGYRLGGLLGDAAVTASPYGLPQHCQGGRALQMELKRVA